MEGVAATALLHGNKTQEELLLRMEVHSLQSHRREKEQHSQKLLRELQLVRAAAGAGSSAPPARPSHLLLPTEAPGGADGGGQQLRQDDQR